MSDAWLDLLRLAVMGAVGLGGAWLGTQATRRKEWWRHRRELYQPILLSLMDLYIHSRHRLRLEEESDPADPKSQAQCRDYGTTPLEVISKTRTTRRDCRATVRRVTSPTPRARRPENVVRASGCRGASDYSGRSSRTRLSRHAHFGGNAATSAAR